MSNKDRMYLAIILGIPFGIVGMICTGIIGAVVNAIMRYVN